MTDGTSIQVERLTFYFESGAVPAQYEVGGQTAKGWPHGCKVVDIVAHDIRRCWLIEAKDFRTVLSPPQPGNLQQLPHTTYEKVRQTLLGMCHIDPELEAERAAHASVAQKRPKKRVVLHLEPHPPGGPQSALFPKRFSASVLQKLKSLVRAIDKHPLVLDIASTPAAGVPWSVT
jgi:hypothetical protein